MFQILGEAPVGIHHPDMIHLYSVTKDQLQLFRSSDESQWRSYSFSSFSIAITCIANAVGNSAGVSLEILKSNNIFFAVVTLALGFFFLNLSSREKKKLDKLEDDILKQPLQEFPENKENTLAE